MWSPQAVLQLQPCILQVNLILTLSAWRWWQTPQVKGSVLQEALHPAPNTLQRQVVSLGCPLSFWPSWYRLEAPMTPSLGSINLLEQFTERGRAFTHSFSSVQSLSRVQLFVTPWTAACQASLSITNSQSLLKLMSMELVMPSNHLILCCPFLLLPSIFPSIRAFQMSVLCIRWPKYWSFSFSISPSNEYSGLISFGMDWLDLLAGQGTLKSLLQHNSSKASILQCSAFFIVQLSHPYMTAGKTIALTRWTFVGKVMSLLFNIVSRFVKAFLPRSKRLSLVAVHGFSCPGDVGS